ncbi:MAG TPA: hypothetical protein VFM94_06375 [Solirubrobacterales bacterium]|nr:hypothetical protein [Solirubrobacterales bacterium]
MIRNLKVLELVLVAILAASAMTASAVSAQQGVLTSDGPVLLDMLETGGVGANAITMFGGKFECPESIYTGNRYDRTPHEIIPSGATTITITPHYNIKKCVLQIGGSNLPFTVDMNQCDFVLYIGTAIAQHTYLVTTDIACPAGKGIELTTFSSSAHAIKTCTITITGQFNLTGPHITSTTATDHPDISGSFKNLTIHQSGLCGTKTTNTAEIDIDVTVEGKSSGWEPTGVTVTG